MLPVAGGLLDQNPAMVELFSVLASAQNERQELENPTINLIGRAYYWVDEEEDSDGEAENQARGESVDN